MAERQLSADITAMKPTDSSIENNLVIMDWAYGSAPGVASWGVTGIGVPASAHATEINAINTANVIRNNTIWFGPNSAGGTGIKVGSEGTDYIISNNTISMSSTGAGIGFNCFDVMSLGTSAYAFMDNNHCYSPIVNKKWELTNGATLAAWRLYSGFDTNSIEGAPLFTNSTSASGYDFTPATGSPLIGAGSNTHKSTYDALGISRLNPPAIGAYEP
jgi:hypothetical protein